MPVGQNKSRSPISLLSFSCSLASFPTYVNRPEHILVPLRSQLNSNSFLVHMFLRQSVPLLTFLELRVLTAPYHLLCFLNLCGGHLRCHMVSTCQGRLPLIAIQRCSSDIGPHVCENEVLPGTPSPLIHQAQIILSRGISLLRRPSVPLQCRLVVLWNALSLGIHHPQIELRRRVSLFRKGTEESCCLSIVTPVIRKFRFLNRSGDCNCRPGQG